MKPATTWILITNGARARVLGHKSIGSELYEVEGMEFSDDVLSISQIMADKAGRAFISMSPARSAMQPKTDPVAKREADFIRLIADILDTKYRNNCFDRLVIFASARAMGDLRKTLSEEVKGVIIAEITKDLTKVPDKEIKKYLENVMLV